MMKKVNQFFLLLFFIIILSVPAYWLIRGKPTTQVSIVEGRVLGLPEKSYPTLKIAMEYIRQGKPELAAVLVWDLFTGGSLQRKFDGAATDQFPFRVPLIMFSKAVDRQIINLSYLVTDDEIIPADMTSDIYIIPDKEALIYSPSRLKTDSFEAIDERLKNYQEITSAYPDINFYIYYLETLEFSKFNPLNKYFAQADKGQSFDYFQSNLPNQINLGALSLTGLDDHLVKYYRTDHHWNTRGILEGYNGIYGMLSKNYANIPKKLTPSAMITFPGIEFLGTLARKTLSPIRGDTFTGFEAEFPTCVVRDQGIEGDYDYGDEYLAGDYSTTPYTSHYEYYFGNQTGLLEYDCETTTNRNILIIGDSYTRPLVALIATQYRHTYYIDFRQDKEFTLSNFLKGHHVEDILIAGGPNVVFMDTNYWMLKP